MLTVAKGLVDETLRVLHTCGDDEFECVVLWSGPIAVADTIDGMLHPPHDADEHGYRIPQDWMHALSLDLRRDQRCVRAQVHTHPRAAFHSLSDDTYPAAGTAGYVSLVVADFARPPVDRAAIHASVLTELGWRRSTFADEVVVCHS